MSTSEHFRLIEQLYEQRASELADVRHLAKPEQIARRLAALKSALRQAPPKKQASRQNMRLLWEYRLLVAKLRCMAADDAAAADGDEASSAARQLLAQWIRDTGLGGRMASGSEALQRRAHTVFLLHFIYRQHTTERLREEIL